MGEVTVGDFQGTKANFSFVRDPGVILVERDGKQDVIDHPVPVQTSCSSRAEKSRAALQLAHHQADTSIARPPK